MEKKRKDIRYPKKQFETARSSLNVPRLSEVVSPDLVQAQYAIVMFYASGKSLAEVFRFAVCNPCQSSPSLMTDYY